MHNIDNKVHLWMLNDEEVTCPALLEKYNSLLSSDEKERLEKLVMPKKKHQFLIVRAVTRQLLAFYTKIKAEQLRFFVNSHGKPYLINNDGNDKSIHQHYSDKGMHHNYEPKVVNNSHNKIFFNISHTEKMIVWAISMNHEVGVDVEHISKKRNILEIARRFFSAQEFCELRNLPQAERTERFFELWTLKEAYVKACGLSITTLLGNDSTNDPFFDNTQCKFWHIKPNSTHKIAIVVL